MNIWGAAEFPLQILAADTDVVDAGEILSQPVDEQDAVCMLKRLRGHAHQVYTGLAVLRASDMRLLTDLIVTDVPMRSYSDEEIEAYVRSGDPLDTAGAYGIQHPGFQPVENLQGCFASVMGLPVCRLTWLLGQFDLPPQSLAIGWPAVQRFVKKLKQWKHPLRVLPLGC